jgi:hypothetical protein
MSKGKLGVVFLASLAIGSAASTLKASPVDAAELPPCPCVACATGGGLACVFYPGRQCAIDDQLRFCVDWLCKPNQQCF